MPMLKAEIHANGVVYGYEKGQGFAYEPGLDHPLLIRSAGDARPGWTLDDFTHGKGVRSVIRIVTAYRTRLIVGLKTRNQV